MLVFDMDGDGAKAGGAEDGLEGLWRRVVEAVVLDVFLHFFAESRMVVDLGDEQEGAAFLEDAANFFEVLGRVGPEVEALDGRDLVEGVVSERQGLDGASQMSILPAAMSAAFVWREVSTEVLA